MKTKMTVLNIVRHFIRNEGYDGLCFTDCGCSVDDLAPCDEGPFHDCVVAVNTGPKHDANDWFEPLVQEWPAKEKS